MPTETNPRGNANNFFRKGDFLKFAVTVLLTLGAVYVFNPFNNIAPLPSIDVDNRISTDQMIDFHSQYINDKPITICYEESGRIELGNLVGYPMATRDLEDIMYRNKVRSASGSIVRPDKIMFFMGQDGTTRYDRHYYGNIKLIAIGVKDGELMVPENRDFWSDKNKSSIYDKADPCPGPGCPKAPNSALSQSN